MTIKKNAVRKTTLTQKAQLMSGSEIERTLVRLAHEILEKNGGVEGLGLVGIRRRGVPIAERLGKMIFQVEKKKVPVGTLDITYYRDDLSTLGPKPVVQEAEIGFPIEGKKIADRRRTLYRPHHSRRLGCPLLARPPQPRTVAGSDRSRPPRIARRGYLHRSNRAGHSQRSHRSEVNRDRRSRKKFC